MFHNIREKNCWLSFVLTVFMLFTMLTGSIPAVQAEDTTTVAVTGVSLDKVTETITVGGTSQLTATVDPADASNQSVTWASDQETDQEYIIKVDKELYANMGNSLAVDYKVRFTVCTGDISIEPMGILPEETPALPLYFTKSNIETNSEDIELNPTISMFFAFNVSGPEVLEFNKKCISLMKGSEEVPIEISAGADVKNIIIEPINDLEPLTDYLLVVTTDLMARNGNTLSSPVYLYFKTRADEFTVRSGGGYGSTSGISISTDINTDDTENIKDSTSEKLYFSDIKESWALKEINWLADRGILSGNPQGEFLPENSITRAEIITMLARALDLSGNETVSFQDVINHWASAYISAAASNGIISGVGNEIFAPDSMVTREQLALMIVRAGKLSAGEKAPMRFADESQISSWANEAVKIANTNGIINGYPDATFRPGQDVTRAEACIMIVNLLNLKK
ncbi:MAG: S-layer homology domain-containing protein [Syntrophomonadaceae bacterium]